MKKTIVSMMMAVALIFGGTAAYAQNRADGNTGATTQVEKGKKGDKACKGNKECKGDKVCKGDKAVKCKKDLKGKKTVKGNRGSFNPFDGIQLTDDQQQKLQILQQGLGPVMLTPQQQGRIPENSNLTPEQKQQLKAERKAKQLEAKKNYLQGVKETLTPEQYVVFLENVYLYSPQNNTKIKDHGKKGGKMKSLKERTPKKDQDKSVATK